MKRTKITYKEHAGRIIITDIQNCADRATLYAEFGSVITGEYLDSYPRYLKNSSGVILRVRCGEKITIPLNKPMSKQTLKTLVFQMRKAGRVLNKIVLKHQKRKTILI